MKSSLITRFLCAYVILASLSMMVVTTLGRKLVLSALINYRANELYSVAEELAHALGTEHFEDPEVLKGLYEALNLYSFANSSTIRLISPDGIELINTAKELDTANPHVIANFDYLHFGPKNYDISTFYNQHDRNMLNVLCPMTRTVNISGFITISVPMDALNNLASQLVQKIEIIFLIILSAALLMMMASFWYFTYRPLKAINRGVGEFSSGNLSYKISASGSNEMSYLSKALNQMAAELKKSNDYQKDFISNVSHDFRSPLTSIKGFAKAMTDGTIPPEMYEKYLNIISQETDRLSKLTKSIMDLNNLNAGKLSLHFTDFDLNRMLKDTVSVFEGSCRDKMLQINLIQTGASTIVHADKEKIEQVIYNLLDNAVKFSERGSVIKVETTLHRNKCFVSIKDQGCGIPKESLPMIWDRFYKADISRGRDRKGTGLGLSIVKEIITAHGQTINVVSTVGVGTEFEFSLDLA